MKKMTLEDLANEFNNSNKSVNHENFDKRMNEEISPRRIRDYVSKSILSKPLKDGRTVYYTESHLKELKDIRKLQKEGFTESYLIKNYNNESDLKGKAESSLQDILKMRGDKENKSFNNQFIYRTLSLFEEDKKDIPTKIDYWNINEKIGLEINSESKISEKDALDIFKKIQKIIKENYND